VEEGLSPEEVAKEIREHSRRRGLDATGRRDRRLVIVEAVLLSVVAVAAAWCGFAAAKWRTEADLDLSKADASHTKAARAFDQSLTLRVGDATAFNAWFAARVARDVRAAAVARRRFRLAYRVAFDAWLATQPFTNPNAPPGPQSMPQYRAAGEAESAKLDDAAAAYFHDGERAATHADGYVRAALTLASVLFLVGISSHLPVRGAQVALVSVGVLLLAFGVVLILLLPTPPVG